MKGTNKRKNFHGIVALLLIFACIFMQTVGVHAAWHDNNKQSAFYVQTLANNGGNKLPVAQTGNGIKNSTVNLLYGGTEKNRVVDFSHGVGTTADSSGKVGANLTDGEWESITSGAKWQVQGGTVEGIKAAYVVFDLEQMTELNEVDIVAGQYLNNRQFIEAIKTSELSIYYSSAEGNWEEVKDSIEWTEVPSLQAREYIFSTDTKKSTSARQLVQATFDNISTRYIKIVPGTGTGVKTLANGFRITEIMAFKRNPNLLAGKEYSDAYPKDADGFAKSSDNTLVAKTALTDGVVSEFSGTNNWYRTFNNSDKTDYINNSLPYVEYRFDTLTKMNQFMIYGGYLTYSTTTATYTATDGAREDTPNLDVSSAERNRERMIPENIHICYSEDGNTWYEATKQVYQSMEYVHQVDPVKGYRTCQALNIFTADIQAKYIRIYSAEGMGVLSNKSSSGYHLRGSFRISEIEAYYNPGVRYTSNKNTNTVYAVNDKWLTSERRRELIDLACYPLDRSDEVDNDTIYTKVYAIVSTEEALKEYKEDVLAGSILKIKTLSNAGAAQINSPAIINVEQDSEDGFTYLLSLSKDLSTGETISIKYDSNTTLFNISNIIEKEVAITSIEVKDSNGNPVTTVSPGQTVTVDIHAEVNKVDHPIVMIVGVYDGNVLTGVELSEPVTQKTNDAQFTATITIDSNVVSPKLCVFLWDMTTLRPFMEKVEK